MIKIILEDHKSIVWSRSFLKTLESEISDSFLKTLESEITVRVKGHLSLSGSFMNIHDMFAEFILE